MKDELGCEFDWDALTIEEYDKPKSYEYLDWYGKDRWRYDYYIDKADYYLKIGACMNKLDDVVIDILQKKKDNAEILKEINVIDDELLNIGDEDEHYAMTERVMMAALLVGNGHLYNTVKEYYPSFTESLVDRSNENIFGTVEILNNMIMESGDWKYPCNYVHIASGSIYAAIIMQDSERLKGIVNNYRDKEKALKSFLLIAVKMRNKDILRVIFEEGARVTLEDDEFWDLVICNSELLYEVVFPEFGEYIIKGFDVKLYLTKDDICRKLFEDASDEIWFKMLQYLYLCPEKEKDYLDYVPRIAYAKYMPAEFYERYRNKFEEMILLDEFDRGRYWGSISTEIGIYMLLRKITNMNFVIEITRGMQKLNEISNSKLIQFIEEASFICDKDCNLLKYIFDSKSSRLLRTAVVSGLINKNNFDLIIERLNGDEERIWQVEYLKKYSEGILNAEVLNLSDFFDYFGENK